MSELTFDKTIDGLDMIVSNMRDASTNNNTTFRKICKEIFQKSYAELEHQNNLDTGAKMLGAGIASLIKMANKQYEQDFFKKSVQKINHQNSILSYSEMALIYSILKDSEFTLVTKLVKIHHNYGLSEVISWVHSCE